MNHLQHHDTWNALLKLLIKSVGDFDCQRWFDKASVFSISDHLVEIMVETETHQFWVEANYMMELQDAVKQHFNEDYQVAVISSPSASICQTTPNELNAEKQVEHFLPNTKKSKKQKKKTAKKADIQSDELEKKRRLASLNTEYVFDRFVVGNSNAFAHAACVAVAEERGVSYNPLFIYGSSGMGKTHLMQSIGNAMLANTPGSKVLYMTCETFINQFIESVKKGNLSTFRNRYRKVDMLLIDDVQFLAGKERSQEEFFHTFNTLLDMQSKIVLVSDCPASKIQQVENRLISRFESGLTVKVECPRVEMRMAIAKRKLEEWHVDLEEEVVAFLAENISQSVRQLEGCLVRLATYSSLHKTTVGIDRAKRLLEDMLNDESVKTVNIELIQKAVCNHFNVEVIDIKGRRRPAQIAQARQIAMYLSRKLTNASLVEIGRSFGGRDHATVLHACKKTEQDPKMLGIADQIDLFNG